MSDSGDDEEIDRPGPMRWVLGGAAVVAVAAMVVALSGPHRKPPPPPQQIVHVVLPKPPPPPPPPPKKEPEEKHVETKNTPVQTAKAVPNKSPKPAPKTPPAPALTAAAGAGTNAFGLGAGNGGGGGSVIGGGGGDDGGGGNAKWGAYAGQIQASLEAALQRDERTRSGHYLLGLRIWLSSAGQVTRAKIVASTGDATLDQAIVAVIDGVAIGATPPADMPQPVNLQVRARTG